MQVSDSKRGDIFPRDVTVRPVRGYAEQQRWDALAARHHYLSFKKFYGLALRHVALSGEAWVALIGWQAGAFKVGARRLDRLDARSAALAASSHREQHSLCHSRRGPGSQHGFAGAWAEPAAPVRRHAGAARLSRARRRELRGPVTIFGHLLPRFELACAWVRRAATRAGPAGPRGSPTRGSQRRYSCANCARARPPSCAARMRRRSGRSKGPPSRRRPTTCGAFAPFSRPSRISASRAADASNCAAISPSRWRPGWRAIAA